MVLGILASFARRRRRVQVVVLVKSIPDASGEIKLDGDFRVKREGDGVLDPGDEFAVEAALKVAEAGQGELAAVSMGPPNAGAAIRRALAMGAHKGVHVSDDALRGADSLATARVLAAAVGRSEHDVILAGVESTDGYTGTVPMAVAELLGIPAVTFARSVAVTDGTARIERQTEAGYDVVECPLPVLVTVTASASEPRFPTLKGIMSAKSKPLEEVSLADLGLSADDVASTQRVTAVDAAPQKGAGQVIPADGEAAAKIADLLAEAKVI
jgi:electron transfer flavoprotein beta subunit